MHRPDSPLTVAGRFSQGNPTQGIFGSQFDAAIANAPVHEICNFIENAGIGLIKGRETQLTEAIMATFAAGLSAADRASIDAIQVGTGQALHKVLGIVDWQQDTAKPGFGSPYSEIGGTLSFGKVGVGIIPPGGLAEGGEVRVVATGEIVPGSSDPTLALKLSVGGVLLRPRVNPFGGDLGGDGWLLNRATLGEHVMHRLLANTRWTLDVTVRSLGRYAAGAGSFPAGNARLQADGWLELEDMGHVSGAIGPFFPAGSPPVHDVWAVGRVYTLAPQLVHHLGQEWETYLDHTAGALDEPGRGVNAPLFWRPTRRRYRIHSTHVLDLADWGTDGFPAPVEVDLELGGAMLDDSTAPAAWSGATQYFVGDQVTHSAKRWYCPTQHNTPGGAREPEVTAGWESYWVEISGEDELWVDSLSMYWMGGTGGREPLRS